MCFVLQVLTALSAIGNTGQPRAVSVLNRCLNYRVPIEVRVAAAQAFRRMPCDADVSRFSLSVCLIVDVSGFCLSLVLWLFRPSVICPSCDADVSGFCLLFYGRSGLPSYTCPVMLTWVDFVCQLSYSWREWILFVSCLIVNVSGFCL